MKTKAVEKSLKELLAGKELEIVKAAIEEEVNRKVTNWFEGCLNKSFESDLEEFPDITDKGSISNIVASLYYKKKTKEIKTIMEKLERYLDREGS